tara:strand:- start:1111 stop:1410 length:300 start_codon:yes stop_codon:yes gene_type:complete
MSSETNNFELDVTTSSVDVVRGTMTCMVKVKNIQPEITTILGEYEITILKPYNRVSSAVHWEIRRKLHRSGIPEITYSAEPPEGFIPDEEKRETQIDRI